MPLSPTYFIAAQKSKVIIKRSSRSFVWIGAVLALMLLASFCWQVAAAEGTLDPDNDTPVSVEIDDPIASIAAGKYRFHARVIPKSNPDALRYRWTPEPIAGQGTTRATYAWRQGGTKNVAVDVQLPDGQSITATQSVAVPLEPPAIVKSGSIVLSIDNKIERYETISATLTLTPAHAAGFHIIWSPNPNDGQGKHEATFSWGTAGNKTISAAVINAGSNTQLITESVTVDSDSLIDERFVYLPIAANRGSATAARTEIIGGDEAEPGAWPWQAVLIDDPDDPASYFCGGTLIAPEWVLTAAHCVQWRQFSPFYVVLGQHRLSSDKGEVIKVQELWIHPNYSFASDDADIALLQLQSAASTTPLPVQVDTFRPGEMATVIGWGQTNTYDNNSDSDVLMQVTVPIVSDDICLAAYGPSVTNNMLCAGQIGKDSCYGDSGGPLMIPSDRTVGWSQIGIVSWGIGCGEADYPGVYTRLSNFTDWIAEYVIQKPPPTPDAYELDDTIEGASVISTDGVSQRHNFHVDGDVDWVQFEATLGKTYTVETSSSAEANDTSLRLYDTNRIEVERAKVERIEDRGENDDQNDDLGGGTILRIRWTAEQSGTHYVQVAAEGGLSTPSLDYELTVFEESIPPDDYEEDDLLESASPILVDDTPQRHSFHVADDQDWLYFEAQAGTVYRIETLNLTEAADTVLRLYGPSEALPLVSNDDGEGTDSSRIEWMAVQSQRIYIEITNYDTGISGDDIRYDIQVVRISDPGIGYAFEPNNLQTTSTPIAVDGTPQTHNFYVGGEPDWLRFVAVEGKFYAIETMAQAENGDTYLALYDGQALLATDDDDGMNVGSRILWQATRTGELYVNARHVFPDMFGAQTHYEVVISEGESIDYPYEPDDGRQEAGPIEIDGVTQRRDFHRPGDVDWISFNATAGKSYRFETFALSANSDTVLRIHDVNGVELAHDDDSGEQRSSNVTWTAPESGLFYLSVHNYTEAIGGPYVQYSLRGLSLSP